MSFVHVPVPFFDKFVFLKEKDRVLFWYSTTIVTEIYTSGLIPSRVDFHAYLVQYNSNGNIYEKENSRFAILAIWSISKCLQSKL